MFSDFLFKLMVIDVIVLLFGKMLHLHLRHHQASQKKNLHCAIDLSGTGVFYFLVYKANYFSCLICRSQEEEYP